MDKYDIGGSAHFNGVTFKGPTQIVTGLKTKDSINITPVPQSTVSVRTNDIPFIIGFRIGWPISLSFLFLYYLEPDNRQVALLIGLATLVLARFVLIRTWQYHGAEHKTANAYWNGLDFTNINNLTSSSMICRECGTTFASLAIVLSLIVVVLSIILPYTFIPVIGALLIPGFTYHIHSAETDSRFVKPIIKGALMIQRLFVSEPSEAQLNVASQTLKELLNLEQKSEQEAKIKANRLSR